MQVNSTFTFNSTEEYVAFCKFMSNFNASASPKKDLDTDKQAGPVAKAESPKAETPKAKAPELHPVTPAAKPEVKSTNDKLKEAQEKKAAEAAKPEAGKFLPDVYTYDNMKEGILAVSQKYQSKKRAFEILSKFGIEKITKDINPDLFEGLVTECQKALEAAE